MKNQKGVALVLIIVAIAVVVLGTAGYFFITKSKSGVNLNLPKLGGPALNSNCDYKDPDLCKYINRAVLGDAFKNGVVMTTISTDNAGKKTKSIFEIDGKENSHMVSYDNDKEAMNIINIKDTTYTKDYTDNKWWKYDSKTAEDNQAAGTEDKFKNQIKELATGMENNITYKKLGKEACGSLTCFKYQMIIKDMSSSVEYIYFDDREYLIRKTRTEGQGDMSIETNLEYRAVTINAPSPIKEGSQFNFPAGKTNDQGTPNVPDKEQLNKIQEEIQKQLEQQTQTETTPSE